MEAPGAGIFGVQLGSVSWSLSPVMRMGLYLMGFFWWQVTEPTSNCLGGDGTEWWDMMGGLQKGCRGPVRCDAWPHVVSLPSCHLFQFLSPTRG